MGRLGIGEKKDIDEIARQYRSQQRKTCKFTEKSLPFFQCYKEKRVTQASEQMSRGKKLMRRKMQRLNCAESYRPGIKFNFI